VNWIASYPDFIERYYSNGIYPSLASFLRIIFGWIPFSVGDILIAFTFIWVLITFIKFFIKKSKSWKHFLYGIGAKLSITYFVFYLFWGMNYYRNPLQKNLNLEIPKYNIEELTLLTEKLLIKTQEIHFQITKNDTVAVNPKLSQLEIYQKTGDGYQSLSKEFPEFLYKHPKVKKSLISLFMAYTGTAGYLNPFTGEAQINYKNLKFTIPAIASHEVAHQLGYANESEANFIGYLAATNNDDLLFQYSGYLMALRYSLSEIYRNDPTLYKEIAGRLPIGIKKNIKASRLQWKKYKNPLDPLFRSIYDTFLKANHQKSGIKSYGKMVSLLMAYELKNGL
jgi:hypothetical protein